MSDDLKIKQPLDAKKINIHEPWEMNYWVKALGVSKDKIVDCVKKVGPMVVDVKRCLGK